MDISDLKIEHSVEIDKENTSEYFIRIDCSSNNLQIKDFFYIYSFVWKKNNFSVFAETTFNSLDRFPIPVRGLIVNEVILYLDKNKDIVNEYITNKNYEIINSYVDEFNFSDEEFENCVKYIKIKRSLKALE